MTLSFLFPHGDIQPVLSSHLGRRATAWLRFVVWVVERRKRMHRAKSPFYDFTALTLVGLESLRMCYGGPIARLSVLLVCKLGPQPEPSSSSSPFGSCDLLLWASSQGSFPYVFLLPASVKVLLHRHPPTKIACSYGIFAVQLPMGVICKGTGTY